MIGISEERLVFGQWLVKKGLLEARVLEAALKIQNEERSDTLRTSPRLLGQILLEDFRVFRNRIELNHALVEFGRVKSAFAAVGRRPAAQSSGASRAAGAPAAAAAHPEVAVPEAAGPALSDGKASPCRPASDPALFGQFLMEKKKVSPAVLERALEIQKLDSSRNMHRSHRLLGEILMDEFNVFSSRVELNRLLLEFNDFKAQLERQRTELMRITR